MDNLTNNEDIRSFCAFCGKPMLPNAQFCSYCGKEQVMPTIVQNVTNTLGNTVSNENIQIQVKIKQQKHNGAIIAAIILASISIVLLIASFFIKFKTSYVSIIFYSGAYRKTVNHDMTSYRLFFGALILATIFFVTSIIFGIRYYVSHKKTRVSNMFTVFVILVTLCALTMGVTAMKLDEKIESYKVVKELDGNKTRDDFIKYDW